MTTLSISAFACIKQANLQPSQLTVLIGPQASGKSVIAKLLYFFNDTLTRQVDSAQGGTDVASFVQSIEVAFKAQFPESAWGDDQFRLLFTSGPFNANITRDKRHSSQIRVELNEAWIDRYTAMVSDYNEVRRKLALKAEAGAALPRLSFDDYWPLQHQHADEMQRLSGPDYVWYQLFAPAGRSFFTTLGKTAMALGSTVLSDNITQKFGRIITTLRDGDYGGSIEGARAILGGEVVKEGDREYLASPDGRRIPLSLMSSGQQEFYPLAVTLDYAHRLSSEGLWIYIEEPEAHLFPSAQSALVDLLVDTVGPQGNGVRMVITSHSPYCLSKINNLLKAGQLAQRQPHLAEQISHVIPENRWLTPDRVAAYAIIDGHLVPLIDETGLIDAWYLDSVSSSLADEFGGLLELEFGE